MRKNFKKELYAKHHEKEKNVPLISKPKRKIYDQANKEMGTLMLQGWTMLAEHCNGKFFLQKIFIFIKS